MKHTHTWREQGLNKYPSDDDSGFVACECGEVILLKARGFTEFRKQRRAGMEPVIDNEGIRLIARKRAEDPRANENRAASLGRTARQRTRGQTLWAHFHFTTSAGAAQEIQTRSSKAQ